MALLALGGCARLAAMDGRGDWFAAINGGIHRAIVGDVRRL
jgi:hypothetical protein